MVLSMKSEICMEIKHDDGREEEVVLGADVFPDEYTSRSDDMLQYPFDLAAGDTVEDFFNILMDDDIPTALERAKVKVGDARFFVRTMVDVEGSPFDPKATDDLTIVS